MPPSIPTSSPVAVDHATADGCEIGLIDTRGGGSDLNQAILLNADVTVIPTSLSAMEDR